MTMMITAQDVYAWRKEHRVSRSRLAELTGLTQTKIYNIENGRDISEDERTRLGRVLFPDAGDRDLPVAGAGGDSDGETGLVPPAAPPVALVGVPEHPLVAELEAQVETTSQPSPRAQQTLDGIRRLGNSEIQTFKSCRRRWWLTYYRGLRLKRDAVTGVRQTGIRLHEALAQWYVPDGTPRTDPRDALEATITRHWTEITNSYLQSGEDVPGHVASQFMKDANLERAMIAGYVQWLEETGEDADLKVIDSEAYVEGEMNEGPENVRIIGRLDVRVRRIHDDFPMFLDHKSVGDFTRPMKTIHLDEQMLHYHLLEWLNTDDADKRCQGALYNMMRRVKGTAAAKPPFFQRTYVPHNTYELESYQQRLAGTIHNLLDVEDQVQAHEHQPALLKMIVYPTPTQDCDWKCPFVGICGMFDDGSRVEAMIEEYYEAGDPYDYYAKDK